MSIRARVEVSGGKEIVERLRRFGVEGINAGKRVLNGVVERTVPKAKSESPVDDNDPEPGGELRDSIRKTSARATAGGRISAGVVAGPVSERGGNIYPIVQHEDMTLKHDEGGPKFVERPLMQEAQDVPGALVAEFDRLLGGR